MNSLWQRAGGDEGDLVSQSREGVGSRMDINAAATNRKDLRFQQNLLRLYWRKKSLIWETFFFCIFKLIVSVLNNSNTCNYTFLVLMEIWKLSALMLTILALAYSVQGLSFTLNRDHWISDNWEVSNGIFCCCCSLCK